VLVEPDDHRIELVGRPEVLINPIVWPEPFGLVMAESLSCGTPVIASPHGGAQEIVEQGRTGQLYQEVDDLVEAAGRVGEIDLSGCRAAAERRFSMERMVCDDVRLYRRLIDQASVPSLIGRTSARPGRRRTHHVAR
jgi:glycosyltransferase involved in cell wall biosynthesis